MASSLTEYVARFVVETSVGICKRQLDHAPPQEIGAIMGKAMHFLAQPI